LKVALIYHEDKLDPEEIINEYFDTDVSYGNDYLTLNGLLHEKLHNVPKISDTITQSLKFTVEQVEKNRSTKICIQKIKNKSEDDS